MFKKHIFSFVQNKLQETRRQGEDCTGVTSFGCSDGLAGVVKGLEGGCTVGCEGGADGVHGPAVDWERVRSKFNAPA